LALSRIVIRLAPNPGTEFADGDDHRGYTITAPLDEDGRVDVAAFEQLADACTVRRFTPDDDPQEGVLRRKGETWFFDYEEGEDDDEPIHRLSDHRFVRGEYLSVRDEDGRLLAYKVTDVQPVE
jgi:hypothetical protein